MSAAASWFTPRRDWSGRNALVPIDTCYRIVDLFSWVAVLMEVVGVIFIALVDGGAIVHVPIYWVAVAALGLQLSAAIFRGWPFLVRYAVFAGALLVFLLCVTITLGITPNWPLLVILLLAPAGLLFGTRFGLLVSAVLCVVHIVVAWAWVKGYLPVAGIETNLPPIYTNFHSVRVWARVLIISAGGFVALQLLMRYVLGDTGRALGDANHSLRLLLAEQEHRVRTEHEIMQLNAELEVRVRERTAELAARVAEVERLHLEEQTLMRDLRSSQQSADRVAARLQEVNSNLLAANQELEAFSHSVSHDLRAPLRNITGFLELFQRRAGGQLEPEAERFVSVVNTEAMRMGHLLDDLLTFSRIGRTELQLQPVDLTALVASLREDLKADIGERVIVWEIGTLPAVRGDPALLRQVMANLLGNAVKFTRPCANARIEIGASPLGRDERTATIFVRDNGAGFNPKYLDKLFGVFQRLHNSRDFEGTGIGLANVKRIITRHGGRVWAEGQVDRGATFYLTLHAA
jgi:signal transduction histidine kinase